MKHKILVLLSIVAIVAVAVFCTHSYDNYQATKRADAAKAYAQHQASVKKQNLKEAQAQSEIQKLEAQCNHDHLAYMAQPVAQRGKTSLQDCSVSLELVQ